MLQTALVYAGLVAAPTAAFLLARRALEGLSRWPGYRRPAAQRPRAERLDRLARELRRLADEDARLGPTAPAARRRAARLAYDDLLREACSALGLADPGRPPLPAVTRLQVEAELSQHGLQW